MSETAYTMIRLEVDLMSEVDLVIQRTKEYGARKYGTRTDFVKDAVVQLLRKYNENKQRQLSAGEIER
jgi:metal-responsive CopG/Arc/MetJ family transcriptional regulator